MFGRELGQPAELLLDPPRTDFVNVPRYAIYLENTLRTAHNYASEQLGKSVAIGRSQGNHFPLAMLFGYCILRDVLVVLLNWNKEPLAHT